MFDNTKKTKKIAGLFVTDLDGTLLTDTGVISEQDIKSLLSLRASGNLVAIATGRSNWSFWKHFTNRSLIPQKPPVDFVIFSTGAGIMEFPSGKIISNIQMDPAALGCVLHKLERAALDYMVPAPIPRTRHFSYRRNTKDNPDFERRLQLYHRTAYPLVELQPIGGATEVLVIVPGIQGEEVWRELGTVLPDFNVIRATSPLDGSSCWIEIFPRNVSKRDAVQYLIDKFSLSEQKVCAVGNDYNDEDLLRWAGQGYLTANGPADLKRDIPCVASNNQGGVAEAAACWLKAARVS